MSRECVQRIKLTAKKFSSFSRWFSFSWSDFMMTISKICFILVPVGIARQVKLAKLVLALTSFMTIQVCRGQIAENRFFFFFTFLFRSLSLPSLSVPLCKLNYLVYLEQNAILRKVTTVNVKMCGAVDFWCGEKMNVIVQLLLINGPCCVEWKEIANIKNGRKKRRRRRRQPRRRWYWRRETTVARRR